MTSRAAAFVLAMAWPAAALAQSALLPDGGQPDAGEVAQVNDSSGYTPPAENQSPLTFTGYVDIGYAHATGNGSSFPPGDASLPLDYGEDAFAPAVNSRGDVASTDSAGRFTNHFLPYSVGIGDRPSFLLNTVSGDVRYAPTALPVMLFTRVQVLPRFEPTGEDTRVLVEQAFARIAPFSSQELALTVGKFDPVFGIEYLENEANLRTGITPSLIARYTTGWQLGAKLFYRKELAPIWSAVSLNVAATNGSSEIEPLQTNTISFTGTPVLSARLGYELNLPSLQVKLGASGMYGPRNDQADPDVRQRAWGFDARVYVAGLSVAGEVIDLQQDVGTTDSKFTGTGEGVFASGFHVRGYYLFAGYAPPLSVGALHKVTFYGRFERRRAQFEGFAEVYEQRITGGIRLDLWDALALKGELLFNTELGNTPSVDNDVQTASLVYTW